MLYGQTREAIRQRYCAAWEKQRRGAALEPLERQIVAVINDHPEYRALLEDSDAALSRDFSPESGQTNPFLHMGMHLAIREQLATDRPAGIIALYNRLMAQHADAHAVEHHMLDCLGEMLWQAQRSGQAPDEAGYMECLQRLASV